MEFYFEHHTEPGPGDPARLKLLTLGVSNGPFMDPRPGGELGLGQTASEARLAKPTWPTVTWGNEAGP